MTYLTLFYRRIQLLQKILLLFQFGVNGLFDDSIVCFHQFHIMLVHHLHKLNFLFPNNAPYLVKPFLNSPFETIYPILRYIYVVCDLSFTLQQLVHILPRRFNCLT